ncbi:MULTISPECIES: AMP-binding protein [unclassified Halomonas]|uniref:AMP-binding protein n=1 Tax=unclassified Halomonas TaxID=2609666 RepID=UPI0028859B69|nr:MULTISPECIES: AMP-binding protein [unclassified Halomonas]MDT0501047.1 AMP-binding protein [Halomonas sp. PAR7]MDT0513238.1 AMP-binding protein [Halomonas sp. LES1]MDT0592250.1 AMP-binding protein [Halomonas sp. PAR8]
MPTADSASNLASFLAARDFLIEHREDYTTACRDFRWPRFTEFNWALDYFDVMARDNDDPALWIVEEDGREARLSFAELASRSNQVANWLRSLGVRRGERALLMLGNEVPLWEVMLAAIKLGAVIIPATPMLTAEDLDDRIARGEVRHLVIGTEHLEKFEGQHPDLTRIAVGGAASGWHDFADSHQSSDAFTPDGPTPADDPMLLYFTSGTTSQPKLVTHTHQSYPVGHLSTLYWIGLQPGDRHLNISSPGWAKHAWSCFFAPWSAGACVFLYNYSRFDAPALLDVLVRYEITTLCAPPTVWRLLIQQDLAAHRVALREAVAAGEPLNPEVIEQVRRAWGLTIRDGFGQTETTAQIGNSPGQPLKSGSMGRPLPGYRVAMLDAEGKPAGEGEVALALGEDRPAGLMVGYANDPERTAAAMQGGYYRTGDVASIDEQGYITYVGRADDVFKASDYRISPFELESVLIEHPAVGEAAIVPSPDPVRTSVPKAYIIPAAGHEPSAELARDIFAFTRERLAPYKRIRRLEFADLPKTISGKIRRVELRQAEADKASDQRGEMEFLEGDFPDLKG